MTVALVIFNLATMHYFYDYIWHTLSPSYFIIWCGFSRDADESGAVNVDEQRRCLSYLNATREEVHVLCLQSTPQSAFRSVVDDANRRDRLWLFVSEQTTISGVTLQYRHESNRFSNLRLLHYSDANAATLLAPDAENGHRRLRHYVVPFVPCQTETFARYWQTEKRYDVAFVGRPSSRRDAILQLVRRKYSVVVVKAFGGDRDAVIAQSRVLVNVHYRDDYRILESLRCVQAFMCGTLVVTERSEPQRHSLVERTFHVAEHYEDLVPTIERVLGQYSSLHARQLAFLENFPANGAIQCAANFTLLALQQRE